MAHTPTPWKLAPTDDTIIRGTDGSYIAAVTGDYNVPALWPVMEANAAFIVKAVNAHQDLVAALEEALEYFEGRQDADCDQDGFIPNKEMQIASEIKRALDRAGVK